MYFYRVLAFLFLFFSSLISFSQRIDSAKYATLYVYHPKGLRVVGFTIHLNDSTICRARYNSKHKIKIYKEGGAEIWMNPKNDNIIKIDLSFGKEYFLKCQLVHNGDSYKQVLKLMDTLQGKKEFENVRKGEDSIKKLKALDTIPRKNIIYAEGGGLGLLYSLNYERMFRINKKVKTSASVGIELIPELPYDFILMTPVSYNFLFGKKNNHLEFGIGLTSFYGKYRDNIGDYYGESTWTNYWLLASPKIGYRFQKINGGIFFKATLTPFINIIYYDSGTKYKNFPQWNTPSSTKYFNSSFFPWGTIFPWAGISAGYTFNFKKQKVK